MAFTVNVEISERTLSIFKEKKGKFSDGMRKKKFLKIVNTVIDDARERGMPEYQVELIGLFLVSPRGHKDERVAFVFTKTDDIINLRFCDFMIHRDSSGGYEYESTQYTNWIDKAVRREIVPMSYAPFIPWNPS